MNLGRAILELRRKNNVTQEDLAAELGVTAAAVSKWENGYTLPDVLMLCALADYFQVTTDELLGRNIPHKHAIVVAERKELGQKIVNLAAKYNIKVCAVFTDHEAGLAYEAEHKDKIQYAFTATDRPFEGEDRHNANGVIHINVHDNGGSDEDKLSGIELYLKNEEAFKNITSMTATRKE